MASITVPDFDSSAVDVLTRNLDQLEGLASCSASLAQADAEGCLSQILIDKALPELALVMLRLTQESQAATEKLWNQYRDMRKLLEASRG